MQGGRGRGFSFGTVFGDETADAVDDFAGGGVADAGAPASVPVEEVAAQVAERRVVVDVLVDDLSLFD